MEFSKQAQAGNTSTQRNTPVQTPPVYAGFEYTGKTALTITGNVTGTRYRFSYPGTRQNIDHRDIPLIMAIPVLRRVN